MLNYDFIEHIKFIDYNCIKGFDYEKYVLLKLQDFYDIKNIYLWKDIPEELLIESGIILNNDLKNIKEKYKKNKYNRNYNVLLDTGIDIIAKLKNEDIILIQCKAYNSIISQKHLSGFFRTLLDCYIINNKKNKKIKGLIVHTNEISNLIKDSYCYKEDIIDDLYIPYDNILRSNNKLLKYKKITVIFIINFNFIILYILYIINIYVNKL